VQTIRRFSLASRLLHWTLAVPFLLLLASGLLLYVPRAKGLHAGSYRVLPLIHVLLGIGLTLGLVIVWFAAPGRRALRDDVQRLFRATPGDRAWLGYAWYALLGAHLQPPPTGKFNAGQKLNAAAMALCTAGLIATGAVLAVNFFTKAVFDARFVERVFPYHDLFMVAAVPFVAGHLFLALLNPATRPSLRGMLDGRVDLAWARRHHSRWVAESGDEAVAVVPAPKVGGQETS